MTNRLLTLGIPGWRPRVALQARATASYPLDDPSAGTTTFTRADATGRGNTLTDTGSVASAIGKLAQAASFAGSNTLSRASTSDLQLAGDWSACCWVKLGSKAVGQAIIAKGTGTAATTEWYVSYSQAADRLRFVVSNGSSTSTCDASSLGSPSTGTWYFVCVRRRASDSTLSIRVNLGTEDSAAGPASPLASTQAFTLGAFTGGGNKLTGLVDEINIFKGHVLTSAEEAYLYNGGTGRSLFTTYALGNLTYSSSIDSLSDLSLRYCYKQGATGLTPMLLMHGYTQQVSDFTDDTLQRMAARGLFIAAVSMRGRDGTSGSQDSGARELYDLYDALAAVRAQFGTTVSSSRAAVVGYSGGGANVLGMAAKFPDTFTDLVDHFGMSDYGAWYTQNAAFDATLDAWIGGNPTAVPNNYLARKHVDGVTNYTGGWLYLYHDPTDATVPVSQSRAVATAMDAVPLTNYTKTESSTYAHNLPNDPASVIASEDVWAPVLVAQTHAVWTVPASGTLHVNGYLRTKRFEVWLGTTSLGGAGGGLSEAADVTYDTATNSYTVTPTTGACDVYIRQSDGKTGTATGITGATLITVA